MRDLLASCHHRERGHLRLNESQMPSTSCAVRFEKVDALREATYRTPLFGRSLSTPLRFIFVGWKQRVTKRMERGFGTKTSIHPSALQNEWVQMRDGMYTLQTHGRKSRTKRSLETTHEHGKSSKCRGWGGTAHPACKTTMCHSRTNPCFASQLHSIQTAWFAHTSVLLVGSVGVFGFLGWCYVREFLECRRWSQTAPGRVVNANGIFKTLQLGHGCGEGSQLP